jgi:predicted flap endonuclease-1-like 5' DNA nuclease
VNKLTAIKDIEGIGDSQAAKLANAGIKTVEALLEGAASSSERKTLSTKTGISESNLLEWVNRADLYRIKGIGSEFSDLLEAAGVDSVPELAQRNPESLLKMLEETNAKKKLVRVLPGLEKVEDFISQAKSLKKVVTH